MAKIYNIAVIKGDGIGPEIVDEAIKALDAASAEFGFELSYNFYLMGGAAIDVFGEPLPSETLNGALNSDAVLFGAIGGPKWDGLPRHLRPESGLLKLRKELGAYANLRPAMIFDELVDASTLKPSVLQGVDFIVVRELTGGIYFGQPREKKENSAYNTMTYTSEEIERIAKVGFETAMKRKKRVCMVDKANVLETSQLWREVTSEVAKSYPEVNLEFMYVDNAAMQLVLKNIPGSRLPFEASPADAPLPWYVLLEVSSLHSEQAAQEGLEAVLSEALADGRVQDAVISQSLAQFEQLWALRENISAAQSHEGKNIKHDISVPISRIGEFIDAASRQIRQAYPEARLIVFGHLGDGNLHFNVAPHARFAQHYDEAFAHDEAQVNRLVHDLVAAYEGAISAEHGIGVLRQAELVRYKQPLELQMMRAIKQALDPQDRMNPGKLLPTPHT